MINTDLEIFLKRFIKKYNITLQSVELEKNINENSQTKKIVSISDYKKQKKVNDIGRNKN
ncbi:hypothetical protein [Clostridioides sp. ZZV14-6044]|uniref:hypothetical protein n=1 Tax=unclassified Clostridioides TaxID=2635829 RepID=UPI001C1BB539|nr:hypothetical protein [Clostridioides sp. ZZV15-6597]MCC0743948.1 hypothetical protein [Clostridioides sp. ZZV14-6044]HBF5866234.1 hypothetical protein [Clostridioides difficile]